MNWADVAALGIMAALASAVIRTVGRYLERRAKPGGAVDPDGLRSELEALRAQLTGQDDLRQRVAELEERLDFAERMLVKRQEQSRLPGAGAG